MNIEILTKNYKQTQKTGELFAKEILAIRPKDKALVIGLKGNLGGGKTTFLQGFAKGLGIKQKILSPTFVIAKRFSLENKFFSNFYHIDCYRLSKAKEVDSLGLKDILADFRNIVAVEWVENIRKFIPNNAVWICFYHVEKNKRRILIRKNVYARKNNNN